MFGVHGFALLAALVLNAAANVLMKVGMTRVQGDGGLLRAGALGAVRAILTSPILLFGLTCFACNALFYMFALQSKTLKISLAYPLMVGGGYAIIAVVGYTWLGERLNLPQTIGVALVLSGVLLIATQTGAGATS